MTTYVSTFNGDDYNCVLNAVEDRDAAYKLWNRHVWEDPNVNEHAYHGPDPLSHKFDVIVAKARQRTLQRDDKRYLNDYAGLCQLWRDSHPRPAKWTLSLVKPGVFVPWTGATPQEDADLRNLKKKYIKKQTAPVDDLLGFPEYTAPTSDKKNPKEKKNMAQNKLIAVPATSLVATTAQTALQNAAWRSAASKVVEVVKVPLVASLKANRDDRAQFAAEFLETPQGTALLTALLGFAPLFSPALAADPRVSRLAAEMQVASAQFVTDFIASNLVGPITAAFQAALQDLPKDPA